MALVEKDAAMMIKDSDAIELLAPEAVRLAIDSEKKDALSVAIRRLGKPNASKDIVIEIEHIIGG